MTTDRTFQNETHDDVMDGFDDATFIAAMKAMNGSLEDGAHAREEASSAYEAALATLTTDSDEKAVNAVLDAFVVPLAEGVESTRRLRDIAKAVGLTPTALKPHVKRQRETLAKAQAAKNHAAALAKHTSDLKLKATGRQIVPLDSETEAIDASWSALAAANSKKDDPIVYMGRMGLSRLYRSPKGTLLIDRLDAAKLGNEMKRHVIYMKVKGNGDELLPRELADDMLKESEWRQKGLKPLIAITNTPKVASDGTIVTARGYHEKMQMYYESADGFVVPTVPDKPTEKDVADALALLFGERGVFEGFAFRDACDDEVWTLARRREFGHASRANLLALLLLPFIRHLIVGPTPLHVITKSKAREGASLFAKVIGIITTGAPMKGTTFQEEVEMRKMLATELADPRDFFFMDNVTEVITGASLNAALTGGLNNIRGLGGNQRIEGEITWTWVADGIGVKLGTETRERTVLITLNSSTVSPAKRSDFVHSKLEEYVRAHRGELVAACLTLIRKWISEGMKSCDDIKMGGFEQWVGVMHGLMKSIGVNGFLENRSELEESNDVEQDEWHDFLAAWWNWRKRLVVPLGDAGVIPEALAMRVVEEHSDREGTSGARPDGGGLLGIMVAANASLEGVDLDGKKNAVKQALNKLLDKRHGARFEIVVPDADDATRHDAVKQIVVEVRRVKSGNKRGWRLVERPVESGQSA